MLKSRTPCDRLLVEMARLRSGEGRSRARGGGCVWGTVGVTPRSRWLFLSLSLFFSLLRARGWPTTGQRWVDDRSRSLPNVVGSPRSPQWRRSVSLCLSSPARRHGRRHHGEILSLVCSGKMCRRRRCRRHGDGMEISRRWHGDVTEACSRDEPNGRTQMAW